MSRGLWRLLRTKSLSPGGPKSSAVSFTALLTSVHTAKINVLTLRLGIARQHALQTDAHALHIVHGAPSLCVQQVQTYDAVAVNVRVDGNGTVGRGAEDDLGRLDRVVIGEGEAQAVEICGWVERVVEDGDVHQPFFEVGRGDKCDAGWESALDLCGGS